MKITRKELIRKYIEFFKSKDHKEIQNASLIPENDPTVLFTTAGMHPLIPFLLGQKHPLGKRLVNFQRCIRTGDIEEVGDSTHHTFFEMLGNWSLGDYFKEDAIKMTFEFLTEHLKIPKEKLAVSCFVGDKNAPKDEEAAKVWKSLGIPEEKIAFLSKEDNWWEMPGTGPCGPDTEIFYWKEEEREIPKKFDPRDERWVEIGNNVLMQYSKDTKGNYSEASQKNIDFGGGTERTVAVLNGFYDNYLIDCWQPIIKKIESLSEKPYSGSYKQKIRIIADHIKAAVFIIADGITPSNTEQGYVLRRLIRRAINYGKQIGIENFTKEVAKPVFEIYDDYKHLEKNKKKILKELEKEEQKFLKTLEKGTNKLNKLLESQKEISGEDAFLLFQSFGFPIEMIRELAKEKGIEVDKEGFKKELEKHQELSRTASAGKFKSGLADSSEKTTKLHTAAHLLLEALKRVLKDDKIKQKGSNINSERLRLDFSFDKKLTEKEKQKVEDLVNEQIQKEIPVIREEMSPQEAKKKGACGVFDEKYGDVISVYTIGDFSKEICTGPHVSNTKELGKLKIQKEQSSSSGVRRIKAVLN